MHPKLLQLVMKSTDTAGIGSGSKCRATVSYGHRIWLPVCASLIILFSGEPTIVVLTVITDYPEELTKP
jgi:hypothetical protein